MFGQLLPEQASAPDSATVYGFAGPATGTLPPLRSYQPIPNLGHAIKGPIFRSDHRSGERLELASVAPPEGTFPPKTGRSGVRHRRGLGLIQNRKRCYRPNYPASVNGRR